MTLEAHIPVLRGSVQVRSVEEEALPTLARLILRAAAGGFSREDLAAVVDVPGPALEQQLTELAEQGVITVGRRLSLKRPVGKKLGARVDAVGRLRGRLTEVAVDLFAGGWYLVEQVAEFANEASVRLPKRVFAPALRNWNLPELVRLVLERTTGLAQADFDEDHVEVCFRPHGRAWAPADVTVEDLVLPAPGRGMTDGEPVKAVSEAERHEGMWVMRRVLVVGAQVADPVTGVVHGEADVRPLLDRSARDAPPGTVRLPDQLDEPTLRRLLTARDVQGDGAWRRALSRVPASSFRIRMAP
jgi:hypothetical protein